MLTKELDRALHSLIISSDDDDPESDEAIVVAVLSHIREQDAALADFRKALIDIASSETVGIIEARGMRQIAKQALRDHPAPKETP
jgi:hypothetical protein